MIKAKTGSVLMTARGRAVGSNLRYVGRYVKNMA